MARGEAISSPALRNKLTLLVRTYGSYCFADVVTADIDYFRVGYGEEVMPRALQALTDFVERHKEEWRRARSRL